MLIESKDGFTSVMVNERKTCTVGKAQPSIFKLLKDSFCSTLDIFSHSDDFDMTLFNLLHKFNRRGMAASHFKKRIGLIEDIIRSIKNGLLFLEMRVNEFGLGVVLVMRNGEGAKSAGVYKDLQPLTSPYRYLS